jgi:hypothetical protein
VCVCVREREREREREEKERERVIFDLHGTTSTRRAVSTDSSAGPFSVATYVCSARTVLAPIFNLLGPCITL